MVTIVPAQNLQPGQRIITRPGKVETVVKATDLDEYGGVSIHTDQHTILTGLPCDVKVVD